MIPILFEKTATSFTGNGLGRIEPLECVVTEERNGQYELVCVVTVDSLHYADIQLNRIIGVIPGGGINIQGFRIYKIEEPLDGRVSVYARHVSYDLSYNTVMPFTAASVTAALTGLKANAVETCPFDFWTDKTTIARFNVSVPCSIRSRLGGVQGSILDVYGGEYEWDNWTVKLNNNRGTDRGVTLRYGKNITDLKQEQNIENVITGIVPYWASEDQTVTLPEKAIESQYADVYPFRRTIPIDFSSSFEEAPSESQLRAKGNSYIANNNVGIPKVSIDVSFLPLWQSEEYKDVAPLERVFLCDTVGVYFERYGINARAKVVKTEWDVLKERYIKIELGEARSTLAQRMVAQEQEVKQEIDNTKTELEKAIDVATEALTGQKGGYWKLNYNANGKPYEMLIMDHETEADSIVIWRYNASGWGVSTDGGTTYRMAATLNSTYGASINADYIVAGTMVANRIRGGVLQSSDSEQNPNFILDLLTGAINAKRLSITTANYKLTEEGTTISFGLRDPEYHFLDYDCMRIVIDNGSLNLELCNHIDDTESSSPPAKRIFRLTGNDGTYSMDRPAIFTDSITIKPFSGSGSVGIQGGSVGLTGELVVGEDAKFYGDVYFGDTVGPTTYAYDPQTYTNKEAYTGYITDLNGTQFRVIRGLIMAPTF